MKMWDLVDRRGNVYFHGTPKEIHAFIDEQVAAEEYIVGRNFGVYIPGHTKTQVFVVVSQFQKEFQEV